MNNVHPCLNYDFLRNLRRITVMFESRNFALCSDGTTHNRIKGWQIYAHLRVRFSVVRIRIATHSHCDDL